MTGFNERLLLYRNTGAQRNFEIPTVRKTPDRFARHDGRQTMNPPGPIRTLRGNFLDNVPGCDDSHESTVALHHR